MSARPRRDRHAHVGTWLVVGAGFTGAVVAERIATQLNERVVVIDRRDHVGGNAFDSFDESGILVHRYGPHIFHTNAPRIWKYLSAFTRWRPYEHSVVAAVDGLNVPVPFNLNSLHMLLPADAARYESKLIETYGRGASIPILKLREARDSDLHRLADFVYEKIFLGYTTKQWGLLPEELDASVTGRVPVRVDRDPRYFQDQFQAMPSSGYTRLFEELLAHNNITVKLGVSYQDVALEFKGRRVVYTGPIDELYDYVYGPLGYRSLRFEFKSHAVERVQEVGTINFPDDRAYTRITEQKFLTGQKGPSTVLVYEYPIANVPGSTEPYYPIPRPSERALHARYLELANQTDQLFWFAGRLADYRYYNMDQAVARGLSLFREIAGAE